MLKMKLSRILLIVMAMMFVSCNSEPERHTLHVVSTGDVHGAWFDDDYLDSGEKSTSLIAVSKKINDLRDSVGAENVLLIDAGDCLQGDVAPYYYNYVKTDVPHLFPRMMKYMGYDCVVIGNHDIETGHAVYDKVRKEMDEAEIPWLGGNAIRENGDIYFQEYKVFERAGLKVLVLGYTNPNIPEWLQEEKWKGLTFNSLVPYVQERVDAVKAKENPDVTVVAVHSGTGNGDGDVFENQGLDLLKSLKGVDLIITAHDHKPHIDNENGVAYQNGGAKAAKIGHSVIEVTKSNGKVMNVNSTTTIDDVDKNDVDSAMKEYFAADYEEVKRFSTNKIGTLEETIRTREAFRGQCAYTNLINTVMLRATDADIAFTAPLTYDGVVNAGDIRYCDLRTIYPFENEMVVLKMKGSEIKGFLELSYDRWINTCSENAVGDVDSHLLKIVENDDVSNGAKGWSFVEKSYNFESAAGLNYFVDVTKPFGERVIINCLADNCPFDYDEFYKVAMTSYRFSGAGDLLPDGAGISAEEAQKRVVAKYREIRDLINDFVIDNQNIKIDLISDKKVLGEWRFEPANVVEPLMEKDMNLLFPDVK
ncbi:MAG: 5'-nucleotidase C-terminal domain-containing protein [Bacteroidales bacterium]|nr:5'-nucleotidase C-terminal domain-containing protein [Bacteroidales bacterium]